jgi:hypothetical protein
MREVSKLAMNCVFGSLMKKNRYTRTALVDEDEIVRLVHREKLDP